MKVLNSNNNNRYALVKRLIQYIRQTVALKHRAKTLCKERTRYFVSIWLLIAVTSSTKTFTLSINNTVNCMTVRLARKWHTTKTVAETDPKGFVL